MNIIHWLNVKKEEEVINLSEEEVERVNPLEIRKGSSVNIFDNRQIEDEKRQKPVIKGRVLQMKIVQIGRHKIPFVNIVIDSGYMFSAELKPSEEE